MSSFPTATAVIVTRPAHQADGLVALIEMAGGLAVRCPTLTIEPVTDPLGLAGQIRRIPAGALLIFVSPNAVEHAAHLDDSVTLNSETTVAAVGEATAIACEAAFELEQVVYPERSGSEGLLAMTCCRRVENRPVFIFGAPGGRGLLEERLGDRGARVENIHVYRRNAAPVDTDALGAAFDGDRQVIVTVTSVSALENLLVPLDDALATRLRGSDLVAGSSRIAAAAREMGFGEQVGARVVDADAADDDSLLKACLMLASVGPQSIASATTQ